MAPERDAGLARADLDVDHDVGGHMIVREPHDLRRRGALAADAAIGDPFLRRDHALVDQQRLGLRAEPVQIFDGEMVGEDDVFIGAMEPMRALALCAVPECAKARLGEDRMARAKRDELARRQATVARERLEDVADIRLGYPDAFLRHSAE